MPYSTQLDLQNRIGLSNLAMLTNDVGLTTTPDANVVASLIASADVIIDGKLGQVYNTPLLRPLTGTVSAGTTALVGTGTHFTTELNVNDFIVGNDGQGVIVVGITDDTHATLAQAPTNAWTNMIVSAVPAIVHWCSLTLASFYAFQRRPSELQAPADMVAQYNRVMGVAGMKGILDQLGDLEIKLDNFTPVTSPESAMVDNAGNVTFNFNDPTNPVSFF